MTDDDATMLTFARTWAPYGGPSRSEIFVTFELQRRQFYQQLRRILDSRPAAGRPKPADVALEKLISKELSTLVPARGVVELRD